MRPLRRENDRLVLLLLLSNGASDCSMYFTVYVLLYWYIKNVTNVSSPFDDFRYSGSHYFLGTILHMSVPIY